MKILTAIVFVLALSGCRCALEKHAIEQMEGTHQIIARKLLEYVAVDPQLDAAAKEDWLLLVEEDRANIDSLKKAVNK